MIPVLFKKDEIQFRTYGLGELSDFLDTPEVKRERNGQYTFYMKYALDGALAEQLEEGMKIKSDAGARTKWQTFEINRVVKKTGQPIEVFAKHISMRTAKDALKPRVRGSNLNGQQLLQLWRNNLVGGDHWEVWSDITTQVNVDWSIEDFNNAQEVLAGREGSILDRIGGEYEFDNQLIRLWRQMGRTAPTVLEYGRNIVSVEKDNQEDSVYTSVYPYAVYTPEGRDTVEMVTLPEIYIDSPYIDMYDHRKVQTVDFTTEFDFDTPPTVDRLRELTTQYIENNEVGSPWENIRVEYQDLSKTLDYQDFKVMEEVELNDVVPVFYPKFNIMNNNAKVVVTVYDPVKEEYKYIELGVIGQRFRSVLTGNLTERLNRVEKEQKQQHQYIVNSAGNRIWYNTPDDSIEHKVGDVWFEENGQYTRIRVWNGSQWEVKNDNEDVAKNAAAIAEAQEGIESAKQSADTANQQINDAITAAGFSTLADLTSDIQSISTRADANALAALDNALSASTTAESAMTLATDLSGQVSDFELTVNGFNQTVNNYTDQVAQFTSDVNGLNSTVASYETQVDEFGNTVGIYATQVSQFQNTVNGLNSTVSNYHSDVQGYQAQVSTLTNTVNGFNATVQRVEADYSDLSGTVQSLGASIGVVEGQITNKVWQTDIQSAVDGIEVGARNLILGTTDEIEKIEVYGWFVSITEVISFESIGLKDEEVFTVSLVLRPLDNHRYRMRFEYYNNENDRLSVYGGRVEPSEKKASHLTISKRPNYHSFRVLITRDNPPSDLNVEYEKLKLERGNKATDWTPAPEDALQLISHVESEWRQTAQGFEQDIIRVETGLDGKASLTEFNTLSETVSGSIQTIGNIEGDITRIEANVNGLQTTVASKASQTQVTQLANGFNVLSQNVIQNLVSNPRFEDGLSGWIMGSGVTNNSSTGPGRTFYNDTSRSSINGNNRIWVAGLQATPGNTYTIKITYNGGDGMDGYIYIGNTGSTTAQAAELPVNGPTVQTRTVTFTSYGSSAISIFFMEVGYYRIREFLVYEGGGASAGQLSVLNDNINARVSKGELMSQINIEAGRTLIQSNRLYLDAESVVFSGNAFIPGAFIENASIDSAKISEIDANIANIINLNTSHITGLNAEFVRTRWNDAVGGNVSIDAGGIDSTQTIGDITHYMNLSGGQIYTESTIQGESTPYTSALFGQGELSIASHTGAGTSISVSGTRIEFIHGTTEGTMRFNGTNFVLDNNLGLFGNHINSVNWLRLIGNNDYEMAIHKHPTASGGAIVDSAMVTLGLGVRNSFSSIAQFYGQIDFRRNLQMLGNDIRSVNRLALENSNTHLLSHPSSSTAGGALVDSTRLTLGIGSPTSFNDRLIITNSEVDITAHLDMNDRRIDQVARLQLSQTSGYFMHLSSGAALVDSRMVTIATGSPTSVSRIADFYGQIHFYRNVYLNGNTIIEGSDERIKENIRDREEDDLSTIKAINYKNYDMIDGNKNQRGFIAQQLQAIDSDLVIENDGQLGYSSSGYIHTIGHGLQQLAYEHDNTLLVASHAYLLAEQHEDEITCLKREVKELKEENKELKEEIKELRGMVA